MGVVLRAVPTLALFLALHTPESFGKRVLTYAGPYKAVVQKWYHCTNFKPTDKLIANVRPHHVLHPMEMQRLTGNITLKTRINDVHYVSCKMDVWNSNQWKENAFLMKFPNKACSSVRHNLPDLYRIFFKKDPYSSEPCFIDPGTFVVERQQINWTMPNIPIIPYGTYRITFSLGDNTGQCGCTIIEGIASPLL